MSLLSSSSADGVLAFGAPALVGGTAGRPAAVLPVVPPPSTTSFERRVSVRLEAVPGRQRFGGDHDDGAGTGWKPQRVSSPYSSSQKNTPPRRKETATTIQRESSARTQQNQGRPSPRNFKDSWETAVASQATTSQNNINNDSNNKNRTIHSHYLATCIPGMVPVLMDELVELGCWPVQASGRSAVAFGVRNLSTALQVLLWCRTAHKILELLVDSSDMGEPESMLYTREDLYAFVRRSIPVEDLLWNPPSEEWRTLAVHVTLNNPRNLPSDLSHSHYTALHIKNALVDAARDWHTDGLRPSVDTTEQVDVPIYAVVRGVVPSNPGSPTVAGAAGAHCTLYRALHPGSLHRRGYRSDTAIHKAALKESTAAGLLRAAGWHETCARVVRQQQEQQEQPHENQNSSSSSSSSIVLLDPMTGSGTFVVEAAMMAADIAPGLMRLKCGMAGARDPPILRWNHADNDDQNDVSALWQDLLWNATQRARVGVQRLQQQQQHDSDTSPTIRIFGNDVHGGAVALARRAVQQAGLSAVVELEQGDCANWKPTPLVASRNGDSPQLMVVANPPWGVRLSDAPNVKDSEDEDEDIIKSSWTSLKTFVRDQCGPATEAWILSGHPQATKYLGLRRKQMLPFQTGQQTLRWLQYEIRDNQPNEDKDNVSSTRHTKRKQPEESMQSRRPRSSVSSYARKPSAREAMLPRQRRNQSTSLASTKMKKAVEENEWLI